MNSKRLWATAATVLALTAFGPHSSGVWAQSDQAACPGGWEWNENSLGQDPCLVSSMLDAECRGIALYTIPPINSTQNYVPPQSDNSMDLTCDCDTVMYSLYMACTTCQGGRIYPWTRWLTQCQNVYISQYPHDIPQGTAIPHWAFFNVTTLPDQTYNDTVAIAEGRNPEATPKAVNTISTVGTSTKTSSRKPSVTVVAPRPTDTDVVIGKSKGKSNVGAIVGGVVGGVVPLILVAVGAFIYMQRRKQGGGNQPPPTPSHALVSEYYKGQPTSPMLGGPTSPGLQYNPYNPADPSTYPAPISDGQSSLSYPYTNPQSPYHAQGRYAGVPEI